MRRYLRYRLRYADVAEPLTERGVRGDPSPVFAWVGEFAPLYEEIARPFRHAVSERWSVDETCAKVAGRWCYVYRAIDEAGQVVDVYISEHRAAGDAAPSSARPLGRLASRPSASRLTVPRPIPRHWR